MEIKQFVPHIPVTEAVLYDGTEDSDLVNWTGGELSREGSEGPWTLTIPSFMGPIQVLQGDVVFRTENGMMGWSPFFKLSESDFNEGYDPVETV